MSETTWQFYLKGEEAWQAMLEACAGARASIDFEQFIFANDRIGRKFLDIFIAKARQGVKVRLLVDSGGSYAFDNSAEHHALIRAGAEVEIFTPIRPWRLWQIASFFFRDHRKILVVDNQVGFTGGVGIEDRMRFWRDTHLKISGPVVAEMKLAFELMWQTIKTGIYKRFRRDWSRLGEFGFIINSPRFRQRHIYHEFARKIRRAEKYIYLAVPYFVPSQRLLFWLRRAAKRGVEIRLLLPDRSDYDMVDAAGRSYYGLLFRFGARIFKYAGGAGSERMLHAKYGVIDDVWGTVGSANLDSLSFVYNYEGNLITSNAEFITQLKAQFANDLLSAKEVIYDDWFRRPWRQKFYEYLTWPFHWIL